MRILAIRGRNLASLEGTFAVELEQPPLERVGLFAITGPTGAGKSTLLDALCLALFDNMPRLPGGQGVIVGRAGEPEGLRIRSNDVRSILRRGAVEGHAEVDFIGNDRHRYRARWDVRRARNRADGRLQEQNLSLISLGTGQTLGRTKKETLALIAERLGLDFDQFRRSVLLAQGDFAAFLKADAKLRSELLERITGTEIYGELSKAAHRRAAEERKLLDELEKQLGAGKPLDAAVRQELEQRRAQEQQKHEQAEQARQTAQRVIDWHNRLMELEKLERAAAADLETAQQALQAAEPRRQEFQVVQQAQAWRSLVADHDRAVQEYEAARQALEQAIRAGKQAREKLHEAQQNRQGKETVLQQASAQREAARPELQQARILDQQLVEARSQYDKARRESTTAAAQLKQAEQQRHKLAAEYQDLQEQRDRAVDWLAGNAHLSDLARQWERWDSEFKRYLQTAGEAESARWKLQQLDKETANLNKRLVQADEQLTVARQAVEIARNQLQTLESAAQLTSLDELRQQRTGLEERRDRLRDWQTLVQEAGVKNTERVQAQTALQEIRRQADNAGREMAEQFKLLEQQRVALGEAERALQLARLAHKEDVKSLRAALQDGEPCPVCGAIEHPWAQVATPPAHWFAEQQQRVDELKHRERELTAAHSRLEASRDHSRQQALEWEARLQTLTTELTTLHQRWAARPPAEALADELLAAGLEQEIANRLAAVETALAKVRESERQALGVQQQIDKVRKELDKRREQNDRLQQTRDGWQQSVQQLGAERTTQKAILERAGQNLQALQEQLAGPLTGMANWRQALTTDASGLHAHCQGQALAWRQRQEDSEALNKRLQAAIPLLREKEVEVRNAGEQAASKTAALQEQQQKLQTWQQQRNALLAGRTADAVEGELIQAEKAARENLERANRELETANSAYIAASKSVEHWNDELGKRKAAQDSAYHQLNRMLTEQGLELATLRRRLQRDTAWLEAERAVLDKLKTDDERTQERLKERRDNREQQQTANPPAQSLEEAQVHLARVQAEGTVAHNAWVEISAQLRQDEDRRTQALQLQKAYAIQRQRWELWESLRELIGSHDGSVFRTYAQSLTLDVLLAHANRHLEDLARRYRLERVPGSDLELQVLDREMGDEVRSVHSLSGGESFLVSLALALGLASLSSHRTQVESLFIDEGFGSLDPETLDIAIASLDALQSLGRKVGVISHVPAMVERIGVQVRVEARGGGKSIVRVLDAGQTASTTGL